MIQTRVYIEKTSYDIFYLSVPKKVDGFIILGQVYYRGHNTNYIKCHSFNWAGSQFAAKVLDWVTCNGRAHYRHLCRKTIVLTCYWWLIHSGVEKKNNIEI
jgi:hypothetical protein